jgi:copper(I)-binding protein
LQAGLVTAAALLVLLNAPSSFAQPKAAQVVLEEASAAWDARQPGRVLVFLVVNNATTARLSLRGVTSPLARTGTLIDGRGKPLEGVDIPGHAELYMTPKGVHVVLERVVDSALEAVPLDISIDDATPVRVVAPFYNSTTDLPDHHDFQH